MTQHRILYNTKRFDFLTCKSSFMSETKVRTRKIFSMKIERMWGKDWPLFIISFFEFSILFRM